MRLQDIISATDFHHFIEHRRQIQHCPSAVPLDVSGFAELDWNLGINKRHEATSPTATAQKPT